MAEDGAAEPKTNTRAPDASGAETLGPGGRALLAGLRALPKNAMSRAMGWLAGRALPGPLQRAEIRLFARLTGIDLSEARDDVDDFATLQAFFTRALRPGVRPIEGDEDVLVSPCDGRWGASGRIEDGLLLQVKGRTYRVSELLGDKEAARRLEGGAFATFYLSPRDYHRFHTPTAGRFVRLEHLPGALWPVNRVGLLGVDGLFARNERICAYYSPRPGSGARSGVGTQATGRSFEARGADGGDDEGGDANLEAERLAGVLEACLVLVPVGATMVGSVRLAFDEMTTNVPGARRTRRDLGPQAPDFARGQEWGHFEFGSTIVLLAPPGRFTLDARPPGTPLRLGEAIGRRLADG